MLAFCDNIVLLVCDQSFVHAHCLFENMSNGTLTTVGNRMLIRLYVSCITNIIPHIQWNISILEKSE